MRGFCARDWIGLRPSRDSREGLYKNLILLRRIGLFYLSALANKFARVEIKKPLCLRQRDLCARDWIRTSTWFPTLRPEHSASTNFATRASPHSQIHTFADKRSF
jgi:hypothetical protein